MHLCAGLVLGGRRFATFGHDEDLWLCRLDSDKFLISKSFLKKLTVANDS